MKKMLAQGVPIDGIGNQGHLDTQYGFPTQLQDDLQRYADLGLKVAITEADVRTFVDGPDTQVPTQALEFPAHTQYYDGMLKACLAVRSCISFTVWGFGDADSWVPGFFTGEGYAGDLRRQPATEGCVLHHAGRPRAGCPRRAAAHRRRPTLVGGRPPV